ncbi:CAP-Gly domain-containing linker protein 1 isoform X2 [Strongylocentrotus purpuratus]|uniref:CAP-Gly domain-containing protein n=1 Tax=Strongylocentrotus purpuratus TaxID=7668 RepID=A0A7M7N4K7_STRPU|nr:CAP-Gly domain-containing linker protein 1 isoform X2 [Strongylocentrotus purpuratus]
MNSASSRSKVKKPCRNKKPSHNANPSYHSGFFCHCSSCRSFHRLFVKDIDVVSKVCATARNKSSLQLSNEAFLDRFKETQLNAKPKWIKLGDRVTARGTHTGIVKYIGPLEDKVISPPTYVGIQLDEPVGLHCGIVNGKRYFETPKGRGLMVKYEEVSKRKPAEKCPPIQGNPMFPSYEPGKYTRLWADSDVGSPVNQTEQWKERGRAKSAPPPEQTASEEQASAKAQQSWSRAKWRISLMFKLDDKGTQRNRPDQLPPKVLQKISNWKKGLGGSEKDAEQLAQTLKKLHLAQEKGRRELEEEREKEEREQARLEREKERERRRLEAAGE